MQNMFDVVFTRNGNVEYFARGMSLDEAQATKTALGSTVTLAITGDNGFQGGGKLTQAISDVRVVRSARSGTNLYNTTSFVEALTVASSGQTKFALTHTPVSSGALTLTVNGSSTRPDVIWELVNDGKYLYVSVPILATTDVVSASYRYDNITSTQLQTISGGSLVESPNSTRTTFTVAHVYVPGTFTCTSSATGTVVVTEGGGNTVEILVGGAAPATGTTLTIGYKYAGDDDTAVPTAETHTWSLPAWCSAAVTQSPAGTNGF